MRRRTVVVLAGLALVTPFAGPVKGQRAASTPADGVTLVEAERLASRAQVSAGGGSVGAQPMAGFGPGWGGDAQLLWTGGAIGAVLDVVVHADQRGRHRLLAKLTRAPDYGQVRFEVNGTSIATPFDGYASKVEPGKVLDLGVFDLTNGPCRISMMITGRNAASSGFLVGIDSFALGRVP